MSILSQIRDWLNESPHPQREDSSCGGTRALPQRRKPVLELTVYRTSIQHIGTATIIRYSDAGWVDLPSEAAQAEACVLQSQILAAYKAFLSYSDGAVPYLHVGDTVIQFSDITALRVRVVGEREALGL